MSLSPHVKNKIKEHFAAGFNDEEIAQALNLENVLTPKGVKWTKFNVNNHRDNLGLNRFRRKKRRKKEVAEAAAVVFKKKPRNDLRELAFAILDCAPAQRKERIELVFKLLGVE